jgi:hypothetical protein
MLRLRLIIISLAIGEVFSLFKPIQDGLNNFKKIIA